MSYTGQNPRFRSTILTDVGVASVGNPAAGSHRLINRGGTFQVQDSTGLETAIGAGGTVDKVTQTAHGFSVGEVLYYTGTAYARALANAANTSEIVGMVSRVIDANTFEITLEGKVTGLTGLTAGEAYFLSPTVSGGITITEPTVLGQVSLPVGVAISTTVIYVRSSRGAVVGSSNARTEIALGNNAVTNVQSVAAYQAGELTGWVEIDGTTDSKFYVAAPFAKNGAATDFNISPQYVGDTPPVGFSMSVTSGGIIQATLPSIPGYVSAKINFALNAPAVGATFPLTIDSTLVQFSTLKAKDSGGFIFQNSSATQNGSFSDLGAVTFGHATLTTTPHILQGKPSSNAILRLQGSPSGSGTYQVWENLTFGALAMGFDAGSNIFKFRANSVSSTVLGELTSAGVWTFGSSSGGAASHLLQGGADTTLGINSGSGNTDILLRVGGVNKLQIVSGAGVGGTQFNSGTGTTFASITTAGGWTFSSSTASSTVAHNIWGRRGTMANQNYILVLNSDNLATGASTLRWGLATADGYAFQDSALSGVGGGGYRFACNTLGVGGHDAEGAWFFGHTAVTSYHTFRANPLTSNYPVLHCYHPDNTATSNNNPGFMVSKRYNDASGAQTFITFEINNTNSVPGNGAGSGRIAANGTNAAQFATYSDVRLKENIFDLNGELNKILSLRPVEFDYKSGGHQIGFIAQEIQEVYPDAVAENSYDGMLVLTGWDKTTARLVKAIQELSAKVTALENKGI